MCKVHTWEGMSQEVNRAHAFILVIWSCGASSLNHKHFFNCVYVFVFPVGAFSETASLLMTKPRALGDDRAGDGVAIDWYANTTKRSHRSHRFCLKKPIISALWRISRLIRGIEVGQLFSSAIAEGFKESLAAWLFEEYWTVKVHTNHLLVYQLTNSKKKWK